MQQTRGKSARRLLARILGLAVAVLGLAALLLAGGLFAVSRGWQRERIVAALETGLSDAVGTPVRIGALGGPLLPGFEVLALRVGPEGSELATARRLAVRVKLDSLLAADPVVIEDLELEGLQLSLRRDADGWNLPELPSRSPDAAGAPVSLWIRRVRAVDSRLALAWLQGETASALAGSFDGEVHEVRIPADATPPSWGAAKLTLTLSQGELAGTPVDRGALEAEVDPAHDLRLAAVAAGRFGEVGLQGRGDLDAWLAGRTDPETRVDLAFDALDLAILSAGETPATRLAGSASLGVGSRTSPQGAPEVVFEAELEPSQLGPVALTGGQLRGSLLDDAWQIDRLALAGQGLSLAGAAAGVGSTPQRVDLKAQIERLDRLSTWLAPGPAAGDTKGAEALAGSLALEVQLSGAVGHADGQVAIDARDLAWRGASVGTLRLRAAVQDSRRAVVESLHLQGDLASLDLEPGAVLRRAGPALSDGVVVEGLRARSLRAQLRADGRITADGFDGLRLQLSDLEAERLGGIDGVAQASAGAIDGDLVLDGPFDAPHGRGWLALRDGAASVPALGETFAPVDGRLRLEEELLRVESLTVGPPGARAELSGQVAVQGFTPGRADLRLRVDDFPLTRVPLPGQWLGNAKDNGNGNGQGDGETTRGAADAPPGPVQVDTGGKLNADLHLTGPLLAPTVAGTLDWENPRWEDLALERIALRVDADEKSARGDLRLRYQGREILVADAVLPIPDDPSEPLDWLRSEDALIEIRGESLDFALLSPFLTRLVRNPHGTADLKLDIHGGRPEPRVDGIVTVADGSIRVPLLRQTFAPVAGIARFDGREVRLESLSVGAPEAGLSAEGSLLLADLRPQRVDLAVQLSNFPASRSSLVSANVDGHVELSGPVRAPALTGALTLRDTRVTVRSADPVAREVRVRSSERDDALRERVREGPSLLERASADLAFTVPGDTWIRSSELELDVQGWARLEKRSLEPVRLSGDLSTRRGTVRVVGKRFRLRRGEAVLDGSSEPDPVLDVEATHRVADIVVVAYVTGRASEPILRLESEPELPEDEVVSYLFFGRPSSQLGAGEQGSVSLAAAGLAAGMALDELRETFGHDLPIDTIDLRIQEGDEASRVEVGKYVAKDVFVRYGHTFGSEPVEEVGVSYRINDNWRVESTTSSDAAAGADLYWTIDY